MTEINKSIGIIVLAAGGAKRMQKPKQLLQYKGKTLLRRAVETAIATNCEPVVVVLGSRFEKMKAEIADLSVYLCHNADWQKGLSSSIQCGIQSLREVNPNTDAFIVALADQPFVTEKHLQKFIDKYLETNISIVAAKYNETIGVPALFDRKVFNEFDQISGDKGAKMIIEKHLNTLISIDLPEAAFDIDTNEDYVKIMVNG